MELLGDLHAKRHDLMVTHDARFSDLRIGAFSSGTGGL